ncbi:MAG: hypothetical protein B6U89_06045 [Desulfurococcales archaeon ex4484_58]|nr:MAG: hypothetical protein B6U89_06045 [Desulfurococcales archaeon ex4484_58]
MPLRHSWSRSLAGNCMVYSIRYRREWLELELYCKDHIATILLNVINGRIQHKDRREPELLGNIEVKDKFFVISCYNGLGNRLWSRVLKGIGAKFLCRKEICVSLLMKPDRKLEINILDKDGEVLDTMGVPNVYDFDIGGSREMIAVTTRGFREESTSTFLIDPSIASIIDHITGFGGHVISGLDLLFIVGYREREVITKVYSNEGEEVLEINGYPAIPPQNPIPYKVLGSEKFEIRKIVIIDKYEVKVFDPYDYSMIYTLMKPPFIRGVIDVNDEDYSITSLSTIMGKPYIVKYGINGNVQWISHIVRGFRYAFVSNKLLAMHVEGINGYETRVYRIDDHTLIHLDTFGSNAYPIFIRKDSILLSNDKIVSAYTWSEE